MGGKNAKVHNKTGCGYRYWPFIWTTTPITTFITTFTTITCTPIIPKFNYCTTPAFFTNQFNPFLKYNPFCLTPNNLNTTGKLFIKSPNGMNLKYKW